MVHFGIYSSESLLSQQDNIEWNGYKKSSNILYILIPDVCFMIVHLLLCIRFVLVKISDSTWYDANTTYESLSIHQQMYNTNNYGPTWVSIPINAWIEGRNEILNY